MDAVAQLQDDLREGRIAPLRLIELHLASQRQLHEAHQRIAELEEQLAGSPTPNLDQPFSLRSEEQRHDARRKKKRKPPRKGRRGRFTTADKVARAEREEGVVPDGVSKGDCQLSHVRPVWRLENGRAMLVAYHIYRGPNNRYGKIPGCVRPDTPSGTRRRRKSGFGPTP